MSGLPTGTVTFLFSDMEGSTRLLQQLGDGEYERQLGVFLRRQRDAFAARGGVEVDAAGDGLFVAFAKPSDALHAAVDAQRALACEAWPDGCELRARMGIHTGEASLAGDTYVGLTVHVASRICSAAHGGQVLVSRSTADLVGAPGSGVRFAELGPHRLKDVHEPVGLYQVLHPDIGEEVVAPNTLSVLPNNLPAQTSTLIGRDDLASFVIKALASSRLVTLVGVGGVGKTRLALRVAEELLPSRPDGVWFCELAHVRDAEAVTHAVASELRVQQTAGRTMLDSLVGALGSKDMLIVLDNCEHVAGAAARLAEAVLRSCPNVALVATSREVLSVAGEQSVPVPPLEVPAVEAPIEELAFAPAVQLFLERARAARPDFELRPDTVAAVVEICRRLDGVPLAIELAAARVRSLGPVDIARRLGERFRFLGGARRSSEERHQTLRSTVAWSYDLLADDERSLFDHLSVFAGPFTLEAVERVCEDCGPDPYDLDNLIAGLVDKSMVGVTETGGSLRYSLLETLREFGAERLAERGTADDVRRRFVAYFAAVAADAEDGLRGPEEPAWVERLERDIDNIREAVTHALDAGDIDELMRSLPGLAIFAYERIRTEIFTWVMAALELPGAADHPRFPELCGFASYGASPRGELDLAAAYARRGLAAAPDPDDPRRRIALMGAALVHLYRGELDEAAELARQSKLAAERAGDAYQARYAAICSCVSAAYAGRLAEAQAPVAEERALALACGSPSAIAWHFYGAGEILLEEDPDQALVALERAVEESRKVGNLFCEHVALVSIASLRGRHGDPRAGLEAFASIVRRWHASGDWQHQWTTLRNLVELFARIGADEAAAVLDASCESSPTAAPVFGAHADRLSAIRQGLEERMGAEAVAIARRRGEALPDEDTVIFALSNIEFALAG